MTRGRPGTDYGGGDTVSQGRFSHSPVDAMIRYDARPGCALTSGNPRTLVKKQQRRRRSCSQAHGDHVHLAQAEILHGRPLPASVPQRCHCRLPRCRHRRIANSSKSYLPRKFQDTHRLYIYYIQPVVRLVVPNLQLLGLKQ